MKGEDSGKTQCLKSKEGEKSKKRERGAEEKQGRGTARMKEMVTRVAGRRD